MLPFLFEIESRPFKFDSLRKRGSHKLTHKRKGLTDREFKVTLHLNYLARRTRRFEKTELDKNIYLYKQMRFLKAS